MVVCKDNGKNGNEANAINPQVEYKLNETVLRQLQSNGKSLFSTFCNFRLSHNHILIKARSGRAAVTVK